MTNTTTPQKGHRQQKKQRKAQTVELVPRARRRASRDDDTPAVRWLGRHTNTHRKRQTACSNVHGVHLQPPRSHVDTSLQRLAGDRTCWNSTWHRCCVINDTPTSPSNAQPSELYPSTSVHCSSLQHTARTKFGVTTTTTHNNAEHSFGTNRFSTAAATVETVQMNDGKIRRLLRVVVGGPSKDGWRRTPPHQNTTEATSSRQRRRQQQQRRELRRRKRKEERRDDNKRANERRNEATKFDVVDNNDDDGRTNERRRTNDDDDDDSDVR